MTQPLHLGMKTPTSITIVQSFRKRECPSGDSPSRFIEMQLPKDLTGLNLRIKNICIRDLESQSLFVFFLLFFFLSSEDYVDLNQKDQYFKYGYLASKL